MIVAEDLIDEYIDHYTVGRLYAIKMVLEDLRQAEVEVKRLQTEVILKGEQEGDKNRGG